MKTELTIDAAGRVVLPKPLRRRFSLSRGATLGLEVGEHEIVLRPRTECPTLTVEGSLTVHEGEPRDDLRQAVEDAREQRDRDLSGM